MDVFGDIGGEVNHKMQVNEAIGAWAIVEEGSSPAVYGPMGAVRTHVWGVDLSGTTQGAGGVGGLVATVIHNGPNAGVYFPVYDGNGNVMGYVRASDGIMIAQYEYGPFGELLRATGPLAQTFNHLFSTKYFDWETGLSYYGHRYYSPTPGRWLSRDPIEEKGGLNLYGFVQNNPVRYVDPFGLYLKRYPGSPDVFWNKWTKAERDAWFKDFKDTFGPLISMMAERHCVLKELLSTVIANEMIDYSEEEYRTETQEFDWRPRSRGPGQITYDTIFREGLFTKEEQRILQIGPDFMCAIHWPGDPTAHMFPHALNGNNSEVEKWLTVPQFNIDVSARLLKGYLDKICKSAESGTMSPSFKNDVAPGCNLANFCCRKGKSCKDVVKYNAPRCLIQALSSVWNNGPRLTTVNDIPNKAPNGYNHGLWAGDLDGIFDP